MTAMTEAARKTCALLVEDDPNIVDLIGPTSPSAASTLS
jgi:hypothetical protein